MQNSPGLPQCGIRDFAKADILSSESLLFSDAKNNLELYFIVLCVSLSYKSLNPYFPLLCHTF